MNKHFEVKVEKLIATIYRETNDPGVVVVACGVLLDRIIEHVPNRPGLLDLSRQLLNLSTKASVYASLIGGDKNVA